MSAAPVGALIIWSDPARLSGLLGLFVIGFALAPIYPLLISETAGRVGSAAAIHAIGFQVAAAYLGTAALPGAAGLLARWQGLEIIGPFLVGTAVGLLVLHEIALRRAHRVGAAQRLRLRQASHAVVLR